MNSIYRCKYNRSFAVLKIWPSYLSEAHSQRSEKYLRGLSILMQDLNQNLLQTLILEA